MNFGINLNVSVPNPYYEVQRLEDFITSTFVEGEVESLTEAIFLKGVNATIVVEHASLVVNVEGEEIMLNRDNVNEFFSLLLLKGGELDLTLYSKKMKTKVKPSNKGKVEVTYESLCYS
jgi:hypothetical protein